MRPRIAITMGDPAGIGPEIILKALGHDAVWQECEPVIYGDREWIQKTAACLPPLPGTPLDVMNAYNYFASTLVQQATDVDLRGIQWGEMSAEAGKAAAQCVIAAAEDAMQGKVDAIVTAPLNKEAMALGGYVYPGHTELLAHVTHTPRYGMLLLSGELRVVHVSTHVSLREAIERVKTARVLECIRLGHRACLDLGIAAPRIAVAGVNPHAGENGLFGTEEETEILPAILAAQTQDMDASGPHPPDTIFARAVKGAFDLVVAMYHDQGHIPVKLHGFESGVNVTVGLPIIRTSVDHGTAFDIAGKGVASETSLLEAIRVAAQMVAAKKHSENEPGKQGNRLGFAER